MNLPKKRPWLILVGIYLAIIALWVTITILAKGNRKDKQGVEHAEELIHKKAQEEQAKRDATPPAKSP